MANHQKCIVPCPTHATIATHTFRPSAWKREKGSMNHLRSRITQLVIRPQVEKLLFCWTFWALIDIGTFHHHHKIFVLKAKHHIAFLDFKHFHA